MVTYNFLFINVLYHDEKKVLLKMLTPSYEGVNILFKNASNRGLGFNGLDKNSG